MHDILRRKKLNSEVNVSTYLYNFTGPHKHQKRKSQGNHKNKKREGNLKKMSMSMTLKALLPLVTMICHHCCYKGKVSKKSVCCGISNY